MSKLLPKAYTPRKTLLLSRSSEVDTQKCAELIGNRYDMILIAAKRGREISRSNIDKPVIDKPVIEALLEIQRGELTRDYLTQL